MIDTRPLILKVDNLVVAFKHIIKERIFLIQFRHRKGLFSGHIAFYFLTVSFIVVNEKCRPPRKPERINLPIIGFNRQLNWLRFELTNKRQFLWPAARKNAVWFCKMLIALLVRRSKFGESLCPTQTQHKIKDNEYSICHRAPSLLWQVQLMGFVHSQKKV